MDSALAGMRVLVVGGAGFIGRPLVRLLLKDGAEVHVADRRPLAAAVVHEGDVRSRRWLKQVMQAIQPKAVVHLAARHFLPEIERHPAAALQVNVIGTQNVIDACDACEPPVQQLVFASSTAVYGGRGGVSDESWPPAPDDIYSLSKLAGEQLVRVAAGRCALGCAILRLANVFGPGDSYPHLITEIGQQLARYRRRCQLQLGNLWTERDYVFVDDVAEAFVAALGREEQLLGAAVAYNIGTGQGRTGYDVVNAVARLTGRRLWETVRAGAIRAMDPKRQVADCSKATRELGWEATTPFEDGLARTLAAHGVDVKEEP